MTIVNPIPVFPIGFQPITPVTPFTYRDGATYLDILEELKCYISDILVPWIDLELDTSQGDIQGIINDLIVQFNAAVTAMLNGAPLFNDPVATALFNNTTSQFRTALNATYETIAHVDTIRTNVTNLQTDVGNLNTLTGSGRLSAGDLKTQRGADIADKASPSSTKLLATQIIGVRPELYGAKGDGTTDDTAAFSAMLTAGVINIELAAKAYLINPDVLAIPEGGSLRGVGSSNVMQGADPVNYSRIIIKNNVATPGTWGVKIGRRGSISGVAIQPSGSIPSYQTADFPTGTGIAATGLYLEDNGTIATDVLVLAFSSVGVDAGNTNRLVRVFSRQSPTGFKLRGNDGIMSECVAMFCMNYGIDCTGAFWRYLGNRIEWNARIGAKSASHAVWVGNLFDRNGAAGLYLNSASWGQVISGNHFHRNGAGGDGTSGRWGVSVPGHPSYVATAAEDSCHIKIDYQRSVTINGNRYSVGRDDASQGVNSPAFIYSSATSSTGTDVYASSNVGERGTVLGYVATAYAGVGAIAGGTDTTMNTLLNRPFSARDGVETATEIKGAGFGPTRAGATWASGSGAYKVNVLAKRSGMVIVSGRGSADGALSVVYWTQDSASTALLAFHENKIGTLISAVAIANNGANDEISLSITGSRNYNYAIVYASQATP